MKIEREVLRSLKIILQRPENYDEWDIDTGDFVSNIHEEIWPDNREHPQYHEKIDGRRIFNVDEVPFHFNMDTKQIVAKGEHAACSRVSMKAADKYQKGTLLVYSNFRKIWMVVVVFPQGGAGVAAKLQRFAGHLGGKIIWDCHKKGRVNQSVWRRSLVAFRNMTKDLRGCRSLSGTDWKYAIALYFDNYIVHLNEKTHQEYCNDYGIFGRSLLKNCSHLQQAIDQHLGQILKLLFREYLESMMSTVDKLNGWNCNNNDVGTEKMREITIRFLKLATQKVK